MDSECSHKAKKKDKQIMPEGSDHQHGNSRWADNWRHHETTNLINAIDQIQNRRGRVGFSFNSSENQEIFNLFMIGIPDSTRAKENIINRIKIVLKMFWVCDDLAKRSGGGWDDDTHRPIAPSVEEYEEMVRAKGEPGRFLLKSNFPWYRKMVTMVGDQTARGEKIICSWLWEEPTHFLLGSQMSIEGSEQSSSNDSDEGNIGAEDQYDSVQQPCRGASSSFTTRGQSSEGTFSKTGNSGSKRKSTDDSSEPNNWGKRYKDKYRKRQAELNQLVDDGFEIVQCLREETKAMMAESEEITKGLAKIHELKLVDDEHDYCLNNLQNDLFRKWFLMHDRDTILRDINKKMRANPNQGYPQPNLAANAVLNQGFPQPSPAANTAPNQGYPQPNQAANNYGSHPNNLNHSVNFM